MSEENQLTNKTEEEKKQEWILKLKWTTFFQMGFFVGLAGYISYIGWVTYNLEITQGIRNNKILALIAILYTGAYALTIMLYKQYKKESGKTW